MSAWMTALLFGALSVTASADRPNCGVVAAANLAQVAGRTVSATTLASLVAAHPGEAITLEEVVQAANAAGVAASAWRASSGELGARGGPVIVHLREPDHFACMVGLDAEWVQLLVGWPATLEVTPRGAFEARYSGYCVLPSDLSAAPHAGPSIATSKCHQEFGVGQAGKPLATDFTISNAGGAPLEIRSTSSSCSCTSTAKPTFTLAPGERTVLSVSLRPSPGRNQFQFVRLATNDPRRQFVYLSLGVDDVPQNIVWSPALIALAGDAPANRVLLRIVGPPEFRVTAVEVESALAEARLVKLDKEDNRKVYTLEVTTAKELPGVGDFTGRLLIHTGLGKDDVVPVPLSLHVPAVARALPERIAALRLDPGQWEGSVLIQATSPGKLDCLGVVVDSLPLTARLVAAAPGVWRLLLAGDLPVGIYRGAAVVRTTSALQPGLRIPVTLAVGQAELR